MCKLNLGVFMYKHHSNQLPEIFSTYFTKHVHTHNYPTRNAQDYSITYKTRKMFSDCAIINCGPTFWNPLDKNIKQSKTIKPFEINFNQFWYLNTMISFLGYVLCDVVCLKCVFICVHFVFHFLVKGINASSLLDLLFISSISCSVCVCGGVYVWGWGVCWCVGVCLWMIVIWCLMILE